VIAGYTRDFAYKHIQVSGNSDAHHLKSPPPVLRRIGVQWRDRLPPPCNMQPGRSIGRIA
jgi:hypothetical protein